MIIELLRTLGILPPPPTPQLCREMDERDERRMIWMDNIILRLRPHTNKEIFFLFDSRENSVSCMLHRTDDEDRVMQLGPSFPETDWDAFWRLLILRIIVNDMHDVRIRVVSTPDRPNRSRHPEATPYFVECRVLRRRQWWNREQPVGRISPNFS